MMRERQAFLDRCCALADEEVASAIESIVVGGSIGRNEADRDSDIDLFLLLQEQELKRFLSFSMVALCRLVGDVLLFRGPVFVDGFGYSFTVLYAPSLICQFNVNTHETLVPNPMWSPGSLVLFDKTGYYSALLRGPRVAIDSLGQFKQSFTFFWLRALTASRYLKRGNLWAVVTLIGDLRNQMMNVLRLSKRVPPPGANYRFPAKGLERQMGHECALIFGPTLCSYDSYNVSLALCFCVDWFWEASCRFVVENEVDFQKELEAAEQLKASIVGFCRLFSSAVGERK